MDTTICAIQAAMRRETRHGSSPVVGRSFALVKENPPAGMLAWCVDSVRIVVGCVEKCEVSSSRPPPAAIVDVASRWSLPFVSLYRQELPATTQTCQIFAGSWRSGTCWETWFRRAGCVVPDG